MRLGPRRGTPMAKLQLTDVEIYVKDLKAARAFYTKKIGLKVRSSMPKWGYLALGATKGGEDAALTPWQPVPEWGTEMYESRQDDWRRDGNRLHYERSEADDCRLEEERDEDRDRRRFAGVRAVHGSRWQCPVPRAAGKAEDPSGRSIHPRVRDGRVTRLEEDGRVLPQGPRHANAECVL